MHVSNGEEAFSKLLNGTVCYASVCVSWSATFRVRGTRSWISALCERHLMRKSNIIIIIRVPSHLSWCNNDGNSLWVCLSSLLLTPVLTSPSNIALFCCVFLHHFHFFFLKKKNGNNNHHHSLWLLEKERKCLMVFRRAGEYISAQRGKSVLFYIWDKLSPQTLHANCFWIS